MVERNRENNGPIAQVLIYEQDTEGNYFVSGQYRFKNPGDGLIIQRISRNEEVNGSLPQIREAAATAKESGELLSYAFYDSPTTLILGLPNGKELPVTLRGPYPVQMDHVAVSPNARETVVAVGIIGASRDAIDKRLKDWSRLLPRIKTL